jgi:DNA polymerase family A
MIDMLIAADLPGSLDRFGNVYVVDTEYYDEAGLPNGRVVPVALQAYEVRSSQWVSVFFEKRSSSYDNPLDPNALFLTFNASAEWNCFLSLGWALPRNCIDFYIEFKNQVSALKPPPQFRQPRNPDKWNSSLLAVARWCGVPVRAAMDKRAARDLILRGHPYSAEDREFVLDYCGDDVLDTALICKVMLPRIGNIPQAIFRAHFMRAVAKIQRAGLPVDTASYARLLKHRDALKLQLVSQLAGTPMDIYEGSTQKYQKLEVLVRSLGLEDAWPMPKRKRSRKHAERPHGQSRKVFSTEVESFESMGVLRPELAPLADVVKRMRDLKAFDLAIGTDGRSRYPLFPFDTATGRCAPPSKRFLFQQSAWTRGLIAPPPGWAISYLDYSAAEVLIAAVLSGDPNMLGDYRDGDPYTNCAIRMGLAPEGSTKETIGALRDIMKVWLLSTLYGASPKSLHDKLPGSTLWQAEEFVRKNRVSYSRYWQWSDLRTDIFLYETGIESTVFGWQHHLDPSERTDEYLFSSARNRSRNFPMQATCAEILRWACVVASDEEITIHAPVHDAVLIGAPDAEIESSVARMRQHMISASHLVLGVEMKVPVPAIIRYPDRMRDPRGAQVWDQMMCSLANLDQKAVCLDQHIDRQFTDSGICQTA